jgi:outer membrane protein TolC
MSIGHQTSIQTQLVQSGANYFAYTGRSYSDTITQGLLSGGSISYSYNGSYLNEGVPLDILNPTSYINMGLSISHNLLDSRGVRVNDRFIRIARRRSENQDLTFRTRLTALVANVLNLYWSYSVALNDLNYKHRNQELAQELATNTQREIDAGAIPAIDIVRAKSNLALQEQAARVSENAATVAENSLKDVLSWHGQQDTILDATHIVPVDQIQIPDVSQIATLSSMLETAHRNRPEIEISRMQEEINAITAYGTANGVLPALRVSAGVSANGQAGTVVPGNNPNPYFVGGAGTALAQVLRRNFPNESVGIGFGGQIHNAQALADNNIDQLTQRQSQLAMQKVSSDLARDISLQRLALQQASTRYRASLENRKYLEQLQQGEEKKWQQGTSSLAAIVQARRDLADAQSAELAAAAGFLRSQIALDQALGQTLEKNNIKVDDAIRSTPE